MPDTAVSVPSPVTSAEGGKQKLARAFGQNLQEVLGSYDIVDRPANVASRIVARIGSWREANDEGESYGSELLSWAPSELPIVDLEDQLEKKGFSLFVPTSVYFKDQRAHAASLDVGLTGVDAAFAGTGSLVLIPGPGKSRVASLLPLHHIALVPSSKIFETFESWLAMLRREGALEATFRDHSQLSFVTGPSKSADIELNLTLGVHGPKDVHVIVFDDSR